MPQDDTRAVRWYRLAAEQGHGQAMLFLGRAYGLGQGGLLQDEVLAYMWLNLATSRTTGANHDTAVEFRDAIASGLPNAQRVEAQRLAREWDEAHPR